MKFNGFPRESIVFLNNLSQNNNRQWFNEQRKDYEQYYLQPAIAFINALGAELAKLIPGIEYEAKVNRSLYRINKDIRFSKDKLPYKNHIGMIFWKGPWLTKHMNPGVYVHLEPNRLLLASGAWTMPPEMLEEYRSMLKDTKKSKLFLKIIEQLKAKGLALDTNNMLKKYPKDFSNDQPMAEYSKYKSAYIELDELGALPDVVHSPELVDYCMSFFANTVDLLDFVIALAARVDVS